MTTRTFPNVQGSNLSGRDYNLPADFEGHTNLLLIAFKREQQADVDTWMPFAASLRRGNESLRYYELPVLGRGYRILRGFIDGGMRSGIPDLEARARTITLYIDKDQFRQALGIQSEDAIQVVLVSPKGEVLWHAEGRFTQARATELQARLASLGTGGPVG